MRALRRREALVVDTKQSESLVQSLSLLAAATAATGRRLCARVFRGKRRSRHGERIGAASISDEPPAGWRARWQNAAALEKTAGLQLTRETHFTSTELKLLYRAFKASAPSAVVDRDRLRAIFGEIFRQGDPERFSDLVFTATNVSRSGFITFAELARSLSALCRGSPDERLEWLHRLYDPLSVGLTWQAIFFVMSAVDDLVGEAAAARLQSPLL